MHEGSQRAAIAKGASPPARKHSEAGSRISGQRILIGLGVTGLLLCAALQLIHVRAHLDPTMVSLCTLNDTVNCTPVMLSPRSILLGLPLPTWGMVGFYSLGLAAWKGSSTTVPIAITGAVASCVLAFLEATQLRVLCVPCGAVHLLTWVSAIVAYRCRPALGKRPHAREMAANLTLPIVALLAAAVLLPAYWQDLWWIHPTSLHRGVDDEQHAWVGAKNPTIVVHEYTDYLCPHCQVASQWMAKALDTHPNRLRLVRHHQPRVRCDPAAMVLCQPLRVALCAQAQDKFWEADRWLFAYARDAARVDVERAAREVGLDLEALETCVANPDTQRLAGHLALRARVEGITTTPTYVVDGRRLDPREIATILAERL